MNHEYSSKNFDHLGIVSQICDEIGIVEKVDSLIPPDPQQKITLGECLKLMVINYLRLLQRTSPRSETIYDLFDVQPRWRCSIACTDCGRQRL